MKLGDSARMIQNEGSGRGYGDSARRLLTQVGFELSISATCWIFFLAASAEGVGAQVPRREERLFRTASKSAPVGERFASEDRDAERLGSYRIRDAAVLDPGLESEQRIVLWELTRERAELDGWWHGSEAAQIPNGFVAEGVTIPPPKGAKWLVLTRDNGQMGDEILWTKFVREEGPIYVPCRGERPGLDSSDPPRRLLLPSVTRYG